MKRFLAFRVVVVAAMLAASIAAAPGSTRFIYQDAIATPNGTTQNVAASIVINPQANGAKVTMTVTGQSPVTVMLAPGQAPPAPQGTPSPQRAQGMLVLQRVALMFQIHRAYPVSSQVEVRIPVLAPERLRRSSFPRISRSLHTARRH